MDEIFSSGKALISKLGWQERIASMKPADELSEPEALIANHVRRLFEDAVKMRLEGQDSVGIMFSGGLDSSYIAALCKRFNANFTCYTVGFQDMNFAEPDDVIEARKVAEFLKLDDEEFRLRLLNIKEIEGIIIKAAKILKTEPRIIDSDIKHVVNTGVGAVELAAYSISKHENIFFSGLGSEEIFAGYDRHRKNPTNEECYNGLLNMYERDLLRDSAISKASGFSFATPFLDKRLIGYCLNIPVRYKINDQGSKMILRNAASDVLGAFAQRPKKAAQYGSKLDKAIGKLAQLKGFRYKADYLKSLE
jgi:diphthine-ammonia ligase